MTTATLSRADAIPFVRFVVDDTGSIERFEQGHNAVVRDWFDGLNPDVPSFKYPSKLVCFMWGGSHDWLVVAVHSYLDVQLTDSEAIDMATEALSEVGWRNLSPPKHVI